MLKPFDDAMNKKKRAMIWGLGSLLVFLFVWQQLQSVRMGYELERVRKLIASQRERNGYLRLELEEALSPDQVARAAGDHLKMLPPSPDAVIVLEPASMDSPAYLPIGNLPLGALRAAVWPHAAKQAAQRWFLAAR